MKLQFTKMQGAGNDFVVIDATRKPLRLSKAQLRLLGDRRFGVGADQILVVEPARSPDADFAYRIFNNTGDEVEHCGNGARCFVRFVHDHGLSQRETLRVETVNNRLVLQLDPDGRVRVDMNRPIFEPQLIPFDPSGLQAALVHDFALWPLDITDPADGTCNLPIAVLSMGNPHAVTRVDDVDTAPVATLGPLIERHPRFARRVNAGFMQVVSRSRIRLRVHERDVGETLACGTGACAAVVVGIRLGWLDEQVDVQTRGGDLTIQWRAGAADSDGQVGHVYMTGPAQHVFEGSIELPDEPQQG